MSRIETRLDELGLTLSAALVPPGNFQLVKIHDGLAYIAGHGPFDGPTPLVQGLVGRDLNVDEAYEAARMTGLSILASLKRELGDLDRVTRGQRSSEGTDDGDWVGGPLGTGNATVGIP